MSEPSNPYQSPGEISDSAGARRKSPLRFVPAVIIGLFGMAATAMSVLVVIVWYRFVIVDNDTTHLLEMIASFLLYLSLGICWLLSGVLIWRGDYRRGTAAGIVGLAILVVIFTLVGM